MMMKDLGMDFEVICTRRESQDINAVYLLPMELQEELQGFCLVHVVLPSACFKVHWLQSAFL